ncbi:MAG: ATP-dependent Clp protease ATP-binding subunit [Planctomycetota bacterium]
MKLPRLSRGAERLITAAADESARLEHHYLGVEHLFLGFTRDKDAPLARACARLGVELAELRELVEKRTVRIDHRPWGDELIFTPRARDVLQLASRIAAKAGATEVEPPHILEAIFRENESVPIRAMRSLDIDIGELRDAALEGESGEEDARESDTPLLDRYGRDLTALARLGRLSPVIGRERELDLLAQVLLRKNKNNPVLVGAAGVGKTAIVEGLARRLASSACPEPLKGNRVVELAVGALVAGTKFRGEFEERLLGIAKEAEQHPNIILFLDEVHTLVGAGAGSGDSLDASNIFKPALARGDLRCIGATTIEEYRRHIEKDPALERRFEKIMVEEPTPRQALEILQGSVEGMEEHHQVTIAADALQAAVDLTVKHVLDRQLPDKAIDALDQSCARRRLQQFTQSVKVEGEKPTITADDITVTVAQWTGIPLRKLTEEATRNLLNLEVDLRSRVIGQDHAVRAVARAILTAKAGLSAPNRPLGVFLFLGPTGVGKTELAKSLAHVLFGDEKRLVRFDMSEFTEPHSVSKLIGAPPGYVGHEREGQLISSLRTHPHSIVLFDEVEKAHPQIFDLFLQIFDDGRLSGAHGKTADFSQAVVILTSNIDPSPDARGAVGFGKPGVEPPAPDLRKGLAQFFRPELVNRIDEVVQFLPLDRNSLRRIIDRYVHDIEQLLAARKAKLQLDDTVYDHLTKLGESEDYGARELRRVVDVNLRQPLAEELLRRGGEAVGTIRVQLEDGRLVFSTASSSAGA